MHKTKHDDIFQIVDQRERLNFLIKGGVIEGTA